MWLLWLSLIGCERPNPSVPESPAAPEPELRLAAPWRVADQDAAGLSLQLGDSADGVRVQLARDELGRVPGVSPIRAGRTLWVSDEGSEWPMIAVPFPEVAVRSAELVVQGVDLVVRLEGPPLSAVTQHEAADDRPIVTLVRLRPRPADWRIVVEGVAIHNLPGTDLKVESAQQGWTTASPWGELDIETQAPSWQSRLDGRWTWSTVGSIEALQPYPKTGMNWRPR